MSVRYWVIPHNNMSFCHLVKLKLKFKHYFEDCKNKKTIYKYFTIHRIINKLLLVLLWIIIYVIHRYVFINGHDHYLVKIDVFFIDDYNNLIVFTISGVIYMNLLWGGVKQTFCFLIMAFYHNQ